MHMKFLLVPCLLVLLAVLQGGEAKSSSSTKSTSKKDIYNYVLKGQAYQNKKAVTLKSSYTQVGSKDFLALNKSICTSSKLAMSSNTGIFKSWIRCDIKKASSKEVVTNIQLSASRMKANKLDPKSSSVLSSMKTSLTKYSPPSSEKTRYYIGRVSSLYAGATSSSLSVAMTLTACVLAIFGKDLL